MQCPISESMIIDYIEDELGPEMSSRVRCHFDECPVCLDQYEAVLRVREMLERGRTEEPDELMEQQVPAGFWEDNLRKVASRTWEAEEPGGGGAGTLPLRGAFRPKMVAAAAVVLLTLTTSLWLGVFSPGGREELPDSPRTELAGLTQEQQEAYLDSLYSMAAKIYAYEMAIDAAESMQELTAADAEYHLSAVASGGLTVSPWSRGYDDLSRLDGRELEKVMVMLASSQ